MTSAGWDGQGGLLGGRYALGDVLGVGSSAVVYRAVDERAGRPVAVKLFEPSSSVDDDRRRRRELDALTRLDHPGLVRLLDGDPTGPRPYLVTELVEGSSLAAALAGGPMRPSAVARAGAELATALAVVHAAGIVHRDVKPANVLLDGDGRPRLADFGVSKARDMTTVTTAGAVTGTAAYMAPEQVRGGTVGPAADVYALALVLLEAVTGRREYPGPAVESALARLSRPPVVPAGLPAPLAAALRAMSATDPAARPSATRCAELLSGNASAPVPAASRARRRVPAVLAGMAAGALVLTGAGIVLSGAAPPPGASAALDPPPPAVPAAVPPGDTGGPAAVEANPPAGAGSGTGPGRSAAPVAVERGSTAPSEDADGSPDGGDAGGGDAGGDADGDADGGGAGGDGSGGDRDDGGGDREDGTPGGGGRPADPGTGPDGAGGPPSADGDRPGRSGSAPGHADD